MPRAPATRDRFRVIGGSWRGRRLSFPALEGLRPTPDRVRETLFNWLSQQVAESRCLDLFCGSGALGLEALSRGASHVSFVDRSPEATDAVRKHLAALDAIPRADVICQAAEDFLKTREDVYEIVFLDPPFSDDQPGKLLEAVGPLLSTYNRVYLETARTTQPDLPPRWQVLRERTAGRVGYRLLTFERSEQP